MNVNLPEYPRRLLESHCVHYLTPGELQQQEIDIGKDALLR